MSDKIVCKKCEWSWKKDDGGDDLYICHKCGNDNTPSLSEKIMNEALIGKPGKFELKWKRQPVERGKYSSFAENELRSYECILKNIDGFQIIDPFVGLVYNVGAGHFSQQEPAWSIMYYAIGGNIQLKYRTQDPKEAMAKFNAYLKEILLTDKYPDFKNRILGMKRLVPNQSK